MLLYDIIEKLGEYFEDPMLLVSNADGITHISVLCAEDDGGAAATLAKFEQDWWDVRRAEASCNKICICLEFAIEWEEEIEEDFTGE